MMALSATCWCERSTVDVTPQQIRAGVTGSCGHRDCRPSGRSVVTDAHRLEQRRVERARQAKAEYDDWLEHHAAPRRVGA